MQVPMAVSLPRRIAAPSPALALRLALSLAVVAAGYLAGAWAGGVTPFPARTVDPYSRTEVLRAVPFDAPLPPELELAHAGRGDQLPYHVEWSAGLAPAEVVADVRTFLEINPKWAVMTDDPEPGGGVRLVLARSTDFGLMTHYAILRVVEGGAGGAIVTLDFTPIPTSLAPE
jgi:hypothetical protein